MHMHMCMHMHMHMHMCMHMSHVHVRLKKYIYVRGRPQSMPIRLQVAGGEAAEFCHICILRICIWGSAKVADSAASHPFHAQV